MRRGIRICIAAMAGAVVVGVGTAHAGVSAYPEPAYTKTAGNNSYWFQWTARTGTDGNGNPDYRYYLCLTTYVNGNYSTPAESSNGTNGPGSQNCTTLLRQTSTQASTGILGFSPFASNTVLSDGARYEMCAGGFYYNSVAWLSDNQGSGCGSTVIDRTPPSASITLAGGATYTSNANLAIRIDYSDAISPPWFDTNGRGFTWGCLSRGGPCAQPTTPANGWSWNQGCSVAAAQQRTTYMGCTWNVAAEADGAYYYCANVADFAVPDNPNGTNQFVATADQANRSAVACDSTVLDRGAPAVTLDASATTVNVGDLVTLSASATDGLSGVSGAYSWTFGDNTAGASGASVTHTYTQAGTYVVKVTTADGAGNPGEATRTITVNPAPSGGGTTTPPPTTTTPPPTTTTPTTSSPSNTSTPSDSSGTTTGSPTGSGATPTTTSQAAQDVGQSSTSTQKQTLGSILGVLAPRVLRVRGRAPAVLLGLTALRPGVVAIQVRKGRRVVARRVATLGRKGVFMVRVPLPRAVAAGRYRLKISYKPRTGAAVTKTLPLTLKRAARAGAASAAPAIVRPLRPVTSAPRPSRAGGAEAQGGLRSP